MAGAAAPKADDTLKRGNGDLLERLVVQSGTCGLFILFCTLMNCSGVFASAKFLLLFRRLSRAGGALDGLFCVNLEVGATSSFLRNYGSSTRSSYL